VVMMMSSKIQCFCGADLPPDITFSIPYGG
jgi:hypothetical protein